MYAAIFFCTIYIASIPLSYVLLKKQMQKDFYLGGWSISDRMFCLFISLFGPIAIVFVFILWLITNDFWDRPASW